MPRLKILDKFHGSLVIQQVDNFDCKKLFQTNTPRQRQRFEREG